MSRSGLICRAILLVALLVGSLASIPIVAASGENGAEADDPATTDADAPRPVVRDDDPLFRGIAAPSVSTRLYAQFGRDDAFLTVTEPGLAATATPSYGSDAAARLRLVAFAPVRTTQDADAGTFYAFDDATAAWSSRFVDDVPVRMEWWLSVGSSAATVAATFPDLVLVAALAVEDDQGAVRVLDQVSKRLDLGHARDGRSVRVPLVMDPVDDGIAAGERLVVLLDWHWIDHLGSVVARPPVVTVHPGSSVDVPLVEPIRILTMDERRVLGDLYIRTRVAHMFSVEALDLDAIQLVARGPSGTALGGKPIYLFEGLDEAHRRLADVDFHLPFAEERRMPGTYDLYVTARHVGDESPRVIAHRDIVLSGASAGAMDPADASGVAAPLVSLLAGVVFSMAVVLSVAPRTGRLYLRGWR